MGKAKSNILLLTVQKRWFDLMVTSDKNMEFRKPSEWIKSRLYDSEGNARHYTHIKFINGYGGDKPYFVANFEGFGTGYDNTYRFSDGSKVIVAKEDFAIFIGQITESGNLKIEHLKKRSSFHTFTLFMSHIVQHSNGAINPQVWRPGRKKLRILLGYEQ